VFDAVASVISFTPPLALVTACMVPAAGFGVLAVKAARAVARRRCERERESELERELAEMSDEAIDDMLARWGSQ
jgi:hypothetical protein